MTEGRVESYVSAQRFSAAGFAVGVIGGACAGLIVGFLYGAVQAIIPIIFVGFPVILFFGTLLGHVTFFFSRRGHIRHLGVITAAAVACGVAALYGAWTADRW